MKKTTTNAETLIYFASIKGKRIFKPIMRACDCLSDAYNGKKAIISISKKMSIELTKMDNHIDGRLMNEKQVISSYQTWPELVATNIENDIMKIGGISC